jgi:hypothetical protein
MQLNDWQKAVARDCGGGDYARFAEHGAVTKDELRHCGDTLFVFLMLELSGDEDCCSANEAMQRLESARSQLEGAIDAVSSLTAS